MQVKATRSAWLVFRVCRSVILWPPRFVIHDGVGGNTASQVFFMAVTIVFGACDVLVLS